MPTRIILSPEITTLLTVIYPTVDWKKVSMYEGLPWFIPDSAASAIVLPSAYSFQHTNIYFKEWNPENCRRLGILVHEGFHILQLQSLQKGVGIGMMRSFLIRYLAQYFQGVWHFLSYKTLFRLRSIAYFEHPMEITAYQHEDNFLECCKQVKLAERYRLNLLQEQDIHHFIQTYPDLIQIDAKLVPCKNIVFQTLAIFCVANLIWLRPIGDLLVMTYQFVTKRIK